MPLSFTERISVAPDVLFRTVGDEAVLLNLKTELYLGLDPVGTRMWTVLQESASLQDAYAQLLTEYEVDPGQLRTDLEEFLLQLREQQLIEIATAGGGPPA